MNFLKEIITYSEVLLINLVEIFSLIIQHAGPQFKIKVFPLKACVGHKECRIDLCITSLKEKFKQIDQLDYAHKQSWQISMSKEI